MVSATRRIRLEPLKKLSGAQNKKLTKEKKMAEGTWVENRPKKPPPIKPSDENNLTVTVPRPSSSGLQGARVPMLSSKRQRSEDSTLNQIKENLLNEQEVKTGLNIGILSMYYDGSHSGRFSQ
jgi:hypothetical protein